MFLLNSQNKVYRAIDLEWHEDGCINVQAIDLHVHMISLHIWLMHMTTNPHAKWLCVGPVLIQF